MDRQNIFEGPYYVPLSQVVSLDGLSYDRDKFAKEEIDILNPRLEALGYDDIHWFAGETDSFGPLSRIGRAHNAAGDLVWFTYG